MVLKIENSVLRRKDITGYRVVGLALATSKAPEEGSVGRFYR